MAAPGSFPGLCRHRYFFCTSEHLSGLQMDMAVWVKQELVKNSPPCKHHSCLGEGPPGHPQVPDMARRGSAAGGSGLTCRRATALVEDTGESRAQLKKVRGKTHST